MLPFLAILLSLAAAQAQDDSPVFVAPSRPLTAGSVGGIWLYCVNSATQAVSRHFEPEVTASLTSVSGSTPVQLEFNTNHGPDTVLLAPGGFARAEYDWAVPAGISGTFTLAVSNYNAVVLQVTAPTAVSPTAIAASAPRANRSTANTGPMTPYLGFLTNHLSTYEPIYFILGTYPAAKFQFSIKYRVFNLTNDDNPIGHFYFAYTQTSFWDLITKDPSFYDTSYKPSAFLLYNDVFQRNGGFGERSLNTVYLQPTATYYLGDSLAWRFQPRVWDYLSVGEYDQDLAQYRGYVDLLTDLTWTDPDSTERIQLGVKARMGDDWEHEGWWLTARFNLAGVPWLRSFNPTIQVEYFTGFGQTLRQYNSSSHGLRAGLCLWY